LDDRPLWFIATRGPTDVLRGSPGAPASAPDPRRRPPPRAPRPRPPRKEAAVESLRAARVVGLGTLASRSLGVLRDAALASALGGGAAADAFAVAFRLPNLLRELVGEGALTSAFVPAYAGRVAAGDREGARRLVRTAFTLLVLVLLATTAAALAAFALLPPSWVDAADPGKGAAILRLAAWCFPYAVLVCPAALLGAALQAEGRFGPWALAPAAMNAAWIGALFALLPLFPGDPAGRATAAAAAALAGGVVQALVPLRALRGTGLSVAPLLDLRQPALRSMLAHLGPAVLGLAPVQVNLVVNSWIAENLTSGDGANASLWYASRLFQLPLSLVGVSLGVVALPAFARLAAEGRAADLGRSVSGALRATAFLSLPAAAGLAALAGPACHLLFRHGRFTTEEADAAAGVLRWACLGLPAFCALQVLTRWFHAVGDPGTPVRVGAAAVAVNLGTTLLLVGPMGAPGLALGASMAAWANLAALAWFARRRGRLRGLRPAAAGGARCAALAIPCGLAAWGAAVAVAGAVGQEGLLARAAVVVAGTVAGALAYAVPAHALRIPEAREFRAALLSRGGGSAGGG
jgi:putative peptidoglycan lipid II flippase